MKIGIITSGFSELIGATDFLRNVIEGLRLRKNNKFYLLVSTKPFLFNKNKFSKRIEKIPILKNFKKEINKLEKISNAYKTDSNEEVNSQKMLKYIDKILDNNKKNITIIKYSTKKELYKILDKYSIEIILPTVNIYNNQKYVSYLFDCQHKYYPQFFSKANLLFREMYFYKICKKSKAIIVNSRDAKNDLIKFYNAKKDNIFNLPFAPIVSDDALKSKINLLKKYKIPKKYFIVSNQFWKHKSLETVLEAQKILEDKGKKYFVVFTGTMEDTRFPNYINELKDYIKKLKLKNNILFLGCIPKRDQLEILKNSVSVIQPTLFEGGPGGGSVFDAVSLGVRVIVTNIPINHELPIKANYLEFFEKQNSEQLAQKMQKFWENEYNRPSNKKLLNNREKYLKAFSDKIYSAIEKAKQ